METLYFILLAALGLVYLIYPAAVLGLAKVRRICFPAVSDSEPAGREPAAWPAISMIITARDEAQCIAAKVRNSKALEYPGATEILIVCDGCKDDTVDQALRAAAGCDSITILALHDNVGKTAAQWCGVVAADGEILVFSDANAELARNALTELVEPFMHDPSIGCTGGSLSYRTSGGYSSALGESRFKRFENALKQAESELHSTSALEGSLFAVRRDVYGAPIEVGPEDAVCAYRALEQGLRTVHVATARSVEPYELSDHDQLSRRARIVSQNLAALANHLFVLNPLSHCVYALMYVQHRLLRWLTPAFLVLTLGLGVMCAANGSPYVELLAAQLLFYLAAISHLPLHRLASGRRLRRLLGRATFYPYAFCLAQAGIALGWWRAMSGHAVNQWEPRK